MRLFIAADLTQEILQKIDKIIAYFQTQSPPGAIKWVNAHNQHLTIKYIGELKEEKLPRVKALMREALQGYIAPTISVAKLGMFPNPVQPRVIWVGIQSNEDLGKIHQSLDLALVDTGVPRESRGFHPHLTLGRIRRQVTRDDVKVIGQTFSQFKVDALGSVRIDEIHLYRSQLTPQGPIYSSLYSLPLNKV